jgi:hypothetical protein
MSYEGKNARSMRKLLVPWKAYINGKSPGDESRILPYRNVNNGSAEYGSGASNACIQVRAGPTERKQWAAERFFSVEI